MADKKNDVKVEDSGEAEVQAKVDEIAEKGFFGQEVDETPRENYTVQGVTGDAGTPETDPEKHLAINPKHILSK